jgi:SNF2 family DNA or RNA helicase
MKIEYVELTGDTREEDRGRNVDTFQNSPTCRVLLGNPQSGGIGVNLTASDISIYYSRNFSLEAELQSQARNHRGGSEIHKKITRIDLVTPGTIDELVMQSLEAKEEIGEKLITQIKAEESLLPASRK